MDEIQKNAPLPAKRANDVHRRPPNVPEIAPGQWYWVADEDDADRKRLACVVAVGTNYVGVEGPPESGKYGWEERILLDTFDARCTYEPDGTTVIRNKVAAMQGDATAIMKEINDLTEELGLKFTQQHGAEAGLVHVGTASINFKSHTKELEKAKTETLPALFERLGAIHERIAQWMAAETFPLRAQCGDMEDVVAAIDSRVFNITLYAGLTEEAKRIKDGKPAGLTEKLHLMQRKVYMDEECLLDYRAGGLSFKNLKEFDKWLCRPDNLSRILPFPRTLVAMQVRRGERETARFSHAAFVNIELRIELDDRDKTTFLYVRNGDQVHRLTCALEFGEKLFPDKNDAVFSDEPMMVKMRAGDRIQEIIPRREWEVIKAAEDEKNRKRAAWIKKHPGKHTIHCPHDMWPEQDSGRYKPLDQSNEYYDEAIAELGNRVRYYNRILLIIQGLLDRSMALHPHPKVNVMAAGFERFIELVYDGTRALQYGKPPDVEAFIAKLNRTLDEGSVTFGQDVYWQRAMAARENNRRDNDWRTWGETRYLTYFKPYNNPGPGVIAEVDKWNKRKRAATYNWVHKASNYPYQREYKANIVVPATDLFNISAYDPGSFKQFFENPVTRAEYLQWAPAMLTAEDYHGGKIKPGHQD